MDNDGRPDLTALPKFDTVFDLHHRMLALAGTTQALAAHSVRHQALYARAWWTSWVEHSTTRGAEALSDPGKFVDSGLERANRAVLELQNSERFIDSQRQLVTAFTHFRTRHREVSESLQQLNHAPTTRDVDDLADSVHDLRRELRGLRRQLAEAQAALRPAERPAPATDPAVTAPSDFRGAETVPMKKESAYGTR